MEAAQGTSVGHALEVLIQPLWVGGVALVCLPATAVVLVRVRRWWDSGRPLPLPLDRAMPAVPWPPMAGFVLFAAMYALMWLMVMYWPSVSDRLGLAPDDAEAPVGVGVLLAMTVPALAGLAVVATYRRRGLQAVGLRLGSVRAGLAYGTVTAVAVFPLCVAGLILSGLVLQRLHVAPQQPELLHTVESAREAHVYWPMAMALFQAAVLAPLAEEFMYRGVLFVSLMKEIGVGGAILGSSLLFALAHAPAQPQSVLSLFVLGGALAYAAYRTRSLVASILTHAAFNTVMVLGTFFGGG